MRGTDVFLLRHLYISMTLVLRMQMKPLIIFGTAEIAEISEYYFRTDFGREVAAFAINGAYLKEDRFCGLPVVAFEEVQRALPATDYDFFVAVGYGGLNALRRTKIEEAEAKGYCLAHYLSSRAYVWAGFSPQPNSFILEDNTLQPFCKVGRGVTLWSGNHIGHHSVIGDYCFLASHVVVSGGVTVGEHSFIGVNATIRDHIQIGARCVIGAGAILLQDAPDESVFVSTATERSKVPSSRLRRI
jgi:sugar O-acyltransferase (sialic acid O-acetyltransferase NeuD family)